MLTLTPNAPIDPLSQRFSLKAAATGATYNITISEPTAPSMVVGVGTPVRSRHDAVGYLPRHRNGLLIAASGRA